MEWYVVIKTIRGRRYRYRQKTWRQGKQVCCRSEYISPEVIIGYHGTFAKFERFSAEYSGSANDCDSSRQGFFFASNPKVAASYASTQVARRRGLQTRIQTIEVRIENLTGMELDEAEDALNAGIEFDEELTRKLGNYFAMRGRALERLNRNEITKLTVSKRAEIKTCVLDLENPYIHDMDGRRYDDEEFSNVAELASEAGHDGVIIRRTYDPGSCFSEANVLTNVYIVFDADQIRSRVAEEKGPA